MSEKVETTAERTSEAAELGLLFLSMADTTWRMVVPGLAIAGLGIMADLKLGTKPWLTLVGLAIGLGVGALLVKRQLGKIK